MTTRCNQLFSSVSKRKFIEGGTKNMEGKKTKKKATGRKQQKGMDERRNTIEKYEEESFLALQI